MALGSMLLVSANQTRAACITVSETGELGLLAHACTLCHMSGCALVDQGSVTLIREDHSSLMNCLALREKMRSPESSLQVTRWFSKTFNDVSHLEC